MCLRYTHGLSPCRLTEAVRLHGKPSPLTHSLLALTYLELKQTDKAKEALQQAVQEYRRVFVNYPRGAQVPTALYKEALALEELKQVKLAQARLQYLVDNFPQSQEAPLARERLKTLAE